MSKLKTLHGVVLIAAFMTSSSVCAQMTLRLDPALDDPGTSSMPARLGYSSSNKANGGVTQFALAYSIVKGGSNSNFLYEPFIALVVNDNASVGSDQKSFELGVKSVFGDITHGTSWLIDSDLARSRDRIAGTSSLEGKFSVEPVNVPSLKFGLGYTPNTWGLFIRPKTNIYYLNTLETDDPVKAPKGRTAGLSVNINVDLFTSFCDRAKITFSGTYARDITASGDRLKDTYKKGKIQLEYAFYDAANPPKGQTLFSLLIERSIGREMLSTSIEKKVSTGIYLGVKL
ncbi:hypothetical protein H8K33_12970 [Undibacterium amnicola]|uniref:Outer membrane beta-barrel porin/alpha-amylase n=1 Tax=Undibacterium amnicola TaxID=1834038 RepID=A0ABR6XSH5_9BURK|nr:hypothetical protein [Undibacterium amnicola]MBC3832411.1 hypothetical protein [Undibacterium amnicola]